MSAPLRAPALALALLACAPPTPRSVARGSTIVLDAEEALLWVASPDDDSVVAIDPRDGSERVRHAVPGGPEQLAWRDRSHLWVTRSRATSVAELDVETGAIVQHDIPCGGARGIVSDGDRVFVACPDDDRVVELPSGTWLEVPGGPAELALFGETLGVSLSRGGGIGRIERALGSIEGGTVTLERVALPEGVAASNAESLAADPVGGFLLGYDRVEHDADRDRDPARGGYGSVLDGMPRIEPRLLSACGDRYARFDGGALAMSGIAALATSNSRVWIAHRSTDGVVLARCAPSEEGAASGSLEVLTTFRTGRAPRGLVLSRDGRTAFVDDGMSWSISRLDVPGGSGSRRTDATWTRTRARGPTALSDAALRGRSLSFDAVDTHLTPSGVVSCGTCHPRGGEDGRVWFLHTPGVPRKLRRTPPAWGARAELLPMHWDGEFTDAAALSRTTTEELMEGDGLLIDFSAIAAYLAEVPLPIARPIADADAVSRGRALFDEAGCAACHAGALYADGSLHAVLPPSSDPDAVVGPVSTPSLVGVRARAPYFHDGRAPRLVDTLTIPSDTHGRTTSLSDDDRADLVSLLESL